MKKILLAGLLLAICLCCGCSKKAQDNAKQSVLDQQNEITSTQATEDTEKLKQENERLKAEVEKLQIEVESLNALIDTLNGIMVGGDDSSYDNPTVEPVAPTSIDAVLLDNEQFTLTYLYSEINKHNEQELYIKVKNKTKTELVVDVESFALDGHAFTDIFGIEHIPANSEGNLKMKTDDLTGFNSPKTISGQFLVKDDTDTKDYSFLWEK